MRIYPIVCPSCQGRGWISNPVQVSNSSQIQCPACNGSKTVIVAMKDKGYGYYLTKNTKG